MLSLATVSAANPTKQGLKQHLTQTCYLLADEVSAANPTKQGLKQRMERIKKMRDKQSQRLIQQNKD